MLRAVCLKASVACTPGDEGCRKGAQRERRREPHNAAKQRVLRSAVPGVVHVGIPEPSPSRGLCQALTASSNGIMGSNASANAKTRLRAGRPTRLALLDLLRPPLQVVLPVLHPLLEVPAHEWQQQQQQHTNQYSHRRQP
jgi:hypothetical protein